ncbi:MAG: hypothetical protein JKY65_14990 [Planctomycetes bacterium]|nr:hypothetical protein [Planctomycetota bacterium]
MGPRLLCFAGGAALSAYFLHLGLLLTPFFGASAFLWACVLAAYLLCMAAGYGVGDVLARVVGAGSLELAAPRLAAAGGILAVVSCYLAPEICRAILNRDPGWHLAPIATLLAASFVPGTLISASVPSEVRARLEKSDTKASAQGALRLIGLVVLGGAIGVVLAARSFVSLDEIDVWPRAYLGGGLLALLSAFFLKRIGRILVPLLLVGCVAVIAFAPSEIQSQQFAVALEQTWRQNQGGSAYYLRTADTDRLSEEDLARRAREAANHEKPGVILTCELLEALGSVSVTGDGLTRSLDLLLDPASKPFLIPLFESLESVRSDGKGVFHCTIKRKRGVQGAFFKLPGAEPGETVEFWFRDDFTIRMLREGNIRKLEFGPVTTIRAGVFELNDTRQTPIRIQNVALWVDASLLGIVIEDHPEQVVIKAIAQGEIGDIKTVDVMAMPKDRKQTAKQR